MKLDNRLEGDTIQDILDGHLNLQTWFEETNTSLETVVEKLRELQDATEKGVGLDVHRSSNEDGAHVMLVRVDHKNIKKPSDEYLAKHGTTGATIKYRSSRAFVKDGTFIIQEGRRTDCCPATGPRFDVDDERGATLGDVLSLIEMKYDMGNWVKATNFNKAKNEVNER